MESRVGRSGIGRRATIAILLALVLLGGAALAAAPAAVVVVRHVVAGGGGRSRSGGLVVQGTIGQSAAGRLAGSGRELVAGFWPGAHPAQGSGTPTVDHGTPTPGGATPATPTSGTPTASATAGAAGTWTVNTTDDTDDGACDAAHCSLREALSEAHRHLAPDTVRFAIPPGDVGCSAGGICTIRPTSPLPQLVDGGTTIDGFSQAGARPNAAPFGEPIDAALRVVLDGSTIDPDTYPIGLAVYSSDNVIRGLVIHGFNTGIDVVESNGNRIEGCFVGVDATGRTAPGNRCIGIALGGHQGGSGSRENRIGGAAPAARNLVSGNGCNGISIGQRGASEVLGNYIGTDATGSVALGNGGGGVRIFSSSANRIGGGGVGEGNLIAFNDVAGVIVAQYGEPTGGNRISRNRIHSNNGPGIALQGDANGRIAPPTIDAATSTRAAGAACAGCTVEVFSDGATQAAVYEGTTTADAAGRWVLDLPGGYSGPHLTATATDADGDTSEISPPAVLPRTTPTATTGTPGTPGPTSTAGTPRTPGPTQTARTPGTPGPTQTAGTPGTPGPTRTPGTPAPTATGGTGAPTDVPGTPSTPGGPEGRILLPWAGRGEVP